jgi:hypothetical protein|eukprot:COSAG01_NODE_2108_length_8408_cov_138.235768_11_plen_230_part_00
MTECSLAALPNDTLVLNARDYKGQKVHAVHRATMWSSDEGVCPPRTLCAVLQLLLRVRVEIMGLQNIGIVGKSQSVLVMINPIIFTRTRTLVGGCIIVGETWGPPLYNPGLPSPVENGDMILGARTPPSLGLDQPLLLTHPNSEYDRANGTLLISTTAGRSWEALLQYSHGCHASSQLVQFSDGTVGVLFDDGGPFPRGYDAMKGDCKDKIQQIVGMNETMVRIKLVAQ